MSNKVTRPKEDMPIVMIATPCYDGNFNEHYVKSLMETFSNIYSAGIGLLWSPMCGSPYLTHARSVLLHLFMTHPVQASHLLFIDADMSWPWDAVPKLVETGKDVVGGYYVNRHKELYCHSIIPGKKVIDGLIEVDGTGTGFLMLSRKACQALTDAAPESMRMDQDGVTEPVPYAINTAITNGKFIGEDIHICRQLTAMGMPTYIHTGLQIGHLRKWIVVGDKEELLNYKGKPQET